MISFPEGVTYLGVDVETYSSVDIGKGTYAYADSNDFEIMLVAYNINGGPVKQFMPKAFMDTLIGFPEDFELDGSEEEFKRMLADEAVIKTAYNANFERTCFRKYYGEECNPDEWRCTQVLTQTMGLPRSLGDAGAALGLPEDQQKLKTGKALIRYFCVPTKPTKANGGRTRNMPQHDLDKWKLFCEYNKQDVVTEQSILERLWKYRPKESEQELWSVDQRICDRGFRVDVPFVRGIVEYDNQRAEKLKEEAKEITGLDNPNSVPQLKGYLERMGVTGITSLDKTAISDLLKQDLFKDVRRVLEIRQSLGKSAVKKYTAILNGVSKDETVKGMLKFYGANRTGRWSGSGVQLQNLYRNALDDLDNARQLVRDGEFEFAELLYGDISEVLAQLVRTAFIPHEGNQFVVTDFSAIEARVIAWVAQEQWRIELFEKGGDIYCESASRIYHVPVEKHGANGHLRQKGKVAELACGYGGGLGAMRAFGAPGEDAEVQEIVDKWREASPNVVALWGKVEKAATRAIQGHGIQTIKIRGGCSIKFAYKERNLLAKLPSGRWICYWGAKVRDRERGFGQEIVYKGVNQTTRQWTDISTWGGKMVENIIQAIARDCLAEKMKEVDRMGYKIVAHVHDEMIVDVPLSDTEAFSRIDGVMAEPISWAPGLPLKGGTYTCPYYQKD